uniref:Uncharacterized protein LOC111111723 n=1 Tax=Crassostrea virginica TaxID=6565 RepID=A0A8B8BML5_CRAVI|nr:uncharacterized protein LOC111111723 [Crassostrea virginica]
MQGECSNQLHYLSSLREFKVHVDSVHGMLPGASRSGSGTTTPSPSTRSVDQSGGSNIFRDRLNVAESRAASSSPLKRSVVQSGGSKIFIRDSHKEIVLGVHT